MDVHYRKILSVIIPVYNTEMYLEESISSVLSQVDESVEVIIINDGSTDKSLEIVNRIISKYDADVEVITQENAGLSAARNRGVSLAQGDYVFFFDSDDIVAPSAIKRMVEKIEQTKEKCDVITFDYEIISELGKRLGTNKINRKKRCDDIQIIDVPNPLSNAWRYVVSKLFFIENELFFRPDVYCEDIDWCTRIFCKNPKITAIDGTGYLYRKNRAGSIMSSLSHKRIQDALDNIYYSYEIVVDKLRKDSLLYREIIELLAAQYYYTMAQLVYAKKDIRYDIIENNKDRLGIFRRTKRVKNKVMYMMSNILGLHTSIRIIHTVRRMKNFVKVLK